MRLIPTPQSVCLSDGVCDPSLVYLATVSSSCPAWLRVQYASCLNENGTIPLTLSCGDDTRNEAYNMTVSSDGVTVQADGPRGAFYALQTWRQLATQGTVPCCAIADKPDLPFRGFYQDVSRGRIPTLDTLKVLVDRLSAWKINSLQLYVEHTHRFREYVGIHDDLGYYTDEDISELDAYCRERCIELIPSLSSFGHLYFLLQSPRYRHLCEMENYTPSIHNWHERLIHHTIDPNNPESFALITSLIAQYLPLFSSNYFNICCDETFDLCKGRNAGGDTTACYATFVSRLAAFLRERGKTTMMWGDIVMQHPETLDTLPEDIVFLNWCYDARGNGLRAEFLEENGRPQIVCPSVHSHKRFVEKIEYSAPNLQNVTRSGLEHGAKGMLITNWGDYGHLCFDEGILYGTALGASVAWNVHGTEETAFEEALAALVYGDAEVIAILRELNRSDELFLESFGYEKALWELTVQFFDNERGVPKDYDRHKADLQKLDLQEKERACAACAARLQELTNTGTIDRRIGETLTLAARGIAVVFGALHAASRDLPYDAAWIDACKAWLAEYKALWFARNQAGEWQRIETFFLKNILGES
ncbi:MAG: family 20 glycosylhydrolase [Clostridia bacterium]|nr:family 20 glycosylhydrolase [Clostridia bacterium]